MITKIIGVGFVMFITGVLVSLTLIVKSKLQKFITDIKSYRKIPNKCERTRLIRFPENAKTEFGVDSPVLIIGVFL